MFEEPSDKPEYTPWTYLAAQSDYLYSIGMFDSYLGSWDSYLSLYLPGPVEENPSSGEV